MAVALEGSRQDVSVDASLCICTAPSPLKRNQFGKLPDRVSYLLACCTISPGAISSGYVMPMGLVGDKDKDGEASLGW